MLYTWLTHHQYASSRALADVMGLDRCTKPDDNNAQDMFFKARFTKCREAVLNHGRSWGLPDNERVLNEIRSMTDHEQVHCIDLIGAFHYP